MSEFIIFVCTDSTEIFFLKLRSAGLNYNLPSFFTDFTVRGVSLSSADKVWTQIKTGILLVLIWVQTVCKVNQKFQSVWHSGSVPERSLKLKQLIFFF